LNQRERLLRIREAIDDLITEIDKEDQPKPKLSLDSVQWLLKGLAPAPKDAAFAFAFATDKEGGPNEYSELVDYLKTSGPVKADGFTYSISENDRFLQRKKEDKR
jgi:hypothetical protein